MRIVGMRHRLIHDYLGVDLEIAWETCRRFLPELRAAVAQLLRSDYAG
jgi:uncharacterized protein with HEPN domain